MEDSDGLTGGADDQWDVQAIADQAPTLVVEQPVGNLFVTPQGEVRLKITANDDLAIHDMALHFSRSDRTDAEDFAVPLVEGPAEPPKKMAIAVGRRQRRQPDARASLDVGRSGLQAGDSSHALDDRQRRYLPQTGKSSIRRVTIITQQESRRSDWRSDNRSFSPNWSASSNSNRKRQRRPSRSKSSSTTSAR